MNKKLIALSSFGLAFMPFFAFAANTNCSDIGVNNGTIEGIICKIGYILNTIIPILVVLGVVYFVFGVVQYVMTGDEEAKSAAKDKIIYGIIGLVVIVAMWGLVGIVTKTFGLNGTATVPGAPCVPGTTGC